MKLRSLRKEQLTVYIKKSSQKFKALFRKSHSQKLIEKRHDAHHLLKYFYIDTERKRERKKVSILNI